LLVFISIGETTLDFLLGSEVTEGVEVFFASALDSNILSKLLVLLRSEIVLKMSLAPEFSNLLSERDCDADNGVDASGVDIELCSAGFGEDFTLELLPSLMSFNNSLDEFLLASF
jgi:hypothetical protein